MDLFKLIQCVKDLTAALKTGDYASTLEHLSHLLGDFATVIRGGPVASSAPPGVSVTTVDLDSAFADLKSVSTASPPVQTAGAGAAGFDPATILVIVELVGKLLDWWKKRNP